MNRRIQSILTCGFLLVCLTAPAAAATTPSQRDFAEIFQAEQTTQFAMSPDGRHVAFTLRAQRRPPADLIILDLEHPEKKVGLQIGGVTTLRWLSDGQLFLGGSTLRVVDADGKNLRPLVAKEDSFEYSQGNKVPRRLTLVLAPGAPPDRIFVSEPRLGISALNLYQVNPATGRLQNLGWTTLDQNAAGGMPVRWILDQEGRLRLQESAAVMQGAMGSGPYMVPQTFDYTPVGASSLFGSRSLDKLLGAGEPMHFEHAAKDEYLPRSVPLVFDGDPEVIYVASSVGRDTYGIYGWNAGTGKRTGFVVEDPYLDLANPAASFSDSIVVFDEGRAVGIRLPDGRGSRWTDPEFVRLQEEVERKFPGRIVNLLQWSKTRDRLALLVDSASDGGRYYVYDRAKTGRAIEVARKMVALPARAGNFSEEVALDTPAGVHLQLTFTLPRQARTTPAPLLAYCRDIPDSRSRAEIARDIQAFTAMGFAVLQVEYRGSAGHGQTFLHAATEAFDRVPIEDLRTGIAWALANRPVDRTRVGLIGENFGGYLALRAMELYPGEFRCGILINAPAEPLAWISPYYSPGPGAVLTDLGLQRRHEFFSQGKSDWGDISALAHADQLVRPVMIVQDRNNVIYFNRYQGLNLRNRLRKGTTHSEYYEPDFPFARLAGYDRAQLFEEMAGFLNERMYDYDVGIGPLKVIE